MVIYPENNAMHTFNNCGLMEDGRPPYIDRVQIFISYESLNIAEKISHFMTEFQFYVRVHPSSPTMLRGSFGLVARRLRERFCIHH